MKKVLNFVLIILLVVSLSAGSVFLYKNFGGVSTLKGEQGEQGEQGEKGPKGDKGDTGASGLDGVDGLTPQIGVNGNWWIGEIDTGIKAQGPQGLQGAPGADGLDGQDGITPQIGVNGNWWIGEIDTGIKAQGSPGIDGLDGVTYDWLTGTTVPASGLGKQGDMYLDTSTQDVYKKTSGTVWTFQCNIKGASGTSGDGAGDSSFSFIYTGHMYSGMGPNTFGLNPTDHPVFNPYDFENKVISIYLPRGTVFDAGHVNIHFPGYVSTGLYFPNYDYVTLDAPMAWGDFSHTGFCVVNIAFIDNIFIVINYSDLLENFTSGGLTPEELLELFGGSYRFEQLMFLLNRYDDIMMLLDMYPQLMDLLNQM